LGAYFISGFLKQRNHAAEGAMQPVQNWHTGQLK